MTKICPLTNENVILADCEQCKFTADVATEEPWDCDEPYDPIGMDEEEELLLDYNYKHEQHIGDPALDAVSPDEDWFQNTLEER